MVKIENVIDTVENCRYCLMCRHVAPLEVITKQESLSPHGLALLVASERRGIAEFTPEVVGKLFSEPDDGVSRIHCVTDQPHSEAFAAVRAEINKMGIAPRAAYDVNDALVLYSNPYQEEKPQKATERGDYALFVGDEVTYLNPSILESALKLLNAIGIEPVLIGQGVNNGYIASTLGFPETAVKLAESILEELATTGASTLLVLSPGDYFTFNQLYDERLNLTLPDSVSLVEVTTLLAGKLSEGSLFLSQAVNSNVWAYVDPTHAIRVPERHPDPRALLSAVMLDGGLELFWRSDRAHPAGNTGLQFTKPELAAQFTRARLNDLVNRGASVAICEDAGTLHQLEGYAEEFGVQVQSLYNLLADHLD